jgi:1,2-diacylglycerol 3-alpha-glucosyltransferase
MTILLSFLTFGPYHFARLAEARRLGEKAGVEVCGLEMARLQLEYAWGDDSDDRPLCASPETPLENVGTGAWKSYLSPILDEVKPDVCAVAGYSHPAMLSLISLCLDRSIPWILMSDSREVDLPRMPWLEWCKGRIVKLASAGFAAGRTHIEYLEKLGLPPGSCSSGYDVVDNDYFAGEAEKWRRSAINEEPAAARLRTGYFLSSSRFIPEKNLFRLLDAFALYRSEVKSAGVPETEWRDFCLLGDGELRSELHARAKALGLNTLECAPWELETPKPESEIPSARSSANATEAGPPRLFLPGFRQIRELPRFYAHAEAVILASTKDTWGLVVNEAMASGLPVLVSNRCGCAPELVREGKNGFTFDPLQVEKLAGLLSTLSAMTERERHAMGETSSKIIVDWGLDRFAGGLLDAANCAADVGPKRAGWLDRLLLKALARR